MEGQPDSNGSNCHTVPLEQNYSTSRRCSNYLTRRLDTARIPRTWHSNHSARTSTGAPLPMCSSRMEPSSTTRWSRTVGAGGIGSMRRKIRCLKDWRRKRERPRKGCGLIRIRCRRGSGGSPGEIDCPAPHLVYHPTPLPLRDIYSLQWVTDVLLVFPQSVFMQHCGRQAGLILPNFAVSAAEWGWACRYTLMAVWYACSRKDASDPLSGITSVMARTGIEDIDATSC
jgi:hypothetical protein